MSRSLQALTSSEVALLLTPLLGARMTGALDEAEALRRIVAYPRRLDAVGGAVLGHGEGLALYCRVSGSPISDVVPGAALDATSDHEPANIGCDGQIVIDLPRGRYLIESLDATGKTVGLESAEGGPIVCGFPDTAHDLVLVIRRVKV